MKFIFQIHTAAKFLHPFSKNTITYQSHNVLHKWFESICILYYYFLSTMTLRKTDPPHTVSRINGMILDDKYCSEHHVRF